MIWDSLMGISLLGVIARASELRAKRAIITKVATFMSVLLK